jgi:hypothetical protein
MGNELRSLFKDLFRPKSEKAVRVKMKAILTTAKEIGGSIEKEAEELNRDVMSFLENPNENISKIKNHALKLEQETREL